MAGKNIIMSREVPVQKNDPAILQTLSDKAVTRLVNGKITDYNGSNIDPYEFILADFKNLASTDYAGIEIRITDVHQTSAGVGGVTFIGGSSWICTSPQIYYATRVAGIAAFPAATYPGLRMVFGDVPGTPLLKSNSTRYVPVSGIATLSKGVYGTSAYPTKSITDTSTAFSFDISTPTFPAGLFADGDSFDCIIRVKRHGINGAMTIKFGIGTAGDSTDDGIFAQTVTLTDLAVATGDIRCDVADATHFVTNYSNGKVSAGAVSQVVDKTTNFNTASAMKLSITGSKNANDTIDLLSYSFVWLAI